MAFQANQEYLSSNQLRARYGGRSHMWVERRLKYDKGFPRPVYFGRLRFWKLSDIEAWERQQATKTHEAA